MRSPAASRPDSAATDPPARQAGPRPPLIVVCGATATGKTALSLAIAEALGETEIVCADSRQVYRGMDIGTAKVDVAARRRVVHHGLDLVDPDEPFTVADFVRHTDAALTGIATSGRSALLVGGTGLYLRAVARGVPVDDTGHDPTVRAQLEARLVGEGLPALVAELRSSAPTAAAGADLSNPRRVVRALERAAILGDAPPPPPRGYPGPTLWLGLTVDAPTHRTWIAERVRGQFEGGLLDEAAALLRRYPAGIPAFSAIGYHEAFAVLGGRSGVTDAGAVATQRTWVYARRQRTWFRQEPEVTWLDGADASATGVAIGLARRFVSLSVRPG